MHEEQKLTGQFGASISSSYQQSSSALLGIKKKAKSRKSKCFEFSCGQVGHVCRDCPRKVEQERSKASHKTRAANEERLDSDTESDTAGAFAASVGSMDSPQMERWLVDSGASSHITNQRELLINYQEFKHPEKVGLGDGRTVDAVGVGNVCVNMQFKVSLRDV